MLRIACLRCFILLIVLSSASVFADKLDDIKKKGEITIGIMDKVPLAFKNKDGKMSGYEIDFAVYIAQRLGVKPTIIPLRSDDRIEALKNDKVDILFGLAKTPINEREVTFGYGYFVTMQKIVAAKDKIKTFADLQKLNIGVVHGSASEKIIKKEAPKAEISEFDNLDAAFNALLAQKIDAVTADEPLLLAELNRIKNPQYDIAPMTIEIKIYAVATVKKQTKLLQQAINKILVDMERNGMAKDIFTHWFGPKTTMNMPRTFKIKS